MDAFWRGDLGHLVLRYSDSVYGGRGQSLSREQLAGLLLGMEKINVGEYQPRMAIERLRHWTVQQYQEHRQIGWYFKGDDDGRVGLAAPTAQLTRWFAASHAACADASNAIAEELPRSTPRPRATDDQIRAWYEEYIKKHLDNGTMTSGEEDYAAARNELGDRLRQKQIRALRRSLAPSDWRIQGRRSKRPPTTE